MIDAGLEAILIKVAGIGLKEAHLGKTLGEMHTTLTRLVRIYLIYVPMRMLTSNQERDVRLARVR